MIPLFSLIVVRGSLLVFKIHLPLIIEDGIHFGGFY